MFSCLIFQKLLFNCIGKVANALICRKVNVVHQFENIFSNICIPLKDVTKIPSYSLRISFDLTS